MIRTAQLKDADAICHVIRRSIKELCKLDYQGSETRLRSWLENKTPANCAGWIEDARSNTFVAERQGQVVGVSHIGHNGHLHLCYVLPQFTGEGLGAQLLAAAENSVLELAAGRLTLESTLTARAFYEHHGYRCCGKTATCLEYVKHLAV